MKSVNILFVCQGNICRSPTAEAIMRKRAYEAGITVCIDSAGVSRWHAGEPPDPRSQKMAAHFGYDLSDQRARVVDDNDFDAFDMILAMDWNNLKTLEKRCPIDQKRKLGLFLDYARQRGLREVPDPFYGGVDGFRHVIELIEATCDGLISHLKAQGS